MHRCRSVAAHHIEQTRHGDGDFHWAREQYLATDLLRDGLRSLCTELGLGKDYLDAFLLGRSNKRSQFSSTGLLSADFNWDHL